MARSDRSEDSTIEIDVQLSLVEEPRPPAVTAVIARQNQPPEDFATARRSQPPPRQHVPMPSWPADWSTPPAPSSARRSSVAPPPDSSFSLPPIARDVSPMETERQMPSLAVSNDALLASLRPARPETVFTWLGRTAAFRRAQRGLDSALFWFSERWQQSVLSLGVGALLGLGVLLSVVRAVQPDEEPSIEELTASAEPESSVQRALAQVPAQAALLAPATVVAKQALEPREPAVGSAVAASAAAVPPASASSNAVSSDAVLDSPADDGAADEGAPDEGTAEKSKPGKKKKKARKHRAKSGDGRSMFQKALAVGRAKRAR
jgi:hypothetical protein